MVRGLTSDSEDSDAPPPRPVVKKKPKRRYSAADPLATSESSDDERPPPRPVARKKKKPAPAPEVKPEAVKAERKPVELEPRPKPKPQPAKRKPAALKLPPRKKPAVDDEEKELQIKTATAAVALDARVKDLKLKQKRLKEVFKKLPEALKEAAKEALKRKETAEEADAKAAAEAADAALAALRAADEPEEYDELAEPVNPQSGDAADEPVATLRGPVSASVLAAMTAPAPVAEAPSAGTASVLPKNIVECVLIKRKAELLGALDIKSLSAVFQTSSTLAALADDASTWHRVYAARRAAPRAAPDAGLAIQTEEQDYTPLIPAPLAGGGGGGGGGAMDIDDLQRMMTGGAAAPVHAMMMNVDDDEAPAEPEGQTVDEVLGGAGATAAAKKALIRAEDQSEQVLGDDPGDAHVLLSSTNAFAGIPSANACSINDAVARSALDKLLKPAGARACWLSPGGSEHADRVRPAPTIGQAFGADDADDADEEGVLPPLIYQQDGCVTKKGSIAVVRIDSKSRERDNEVPPDLDLAIAIRDCSLELKDQREALEAIKDDLRQWEGLKLKLENGTVKVGKSKLPEYGVGLKVDVNLWENALTDDMRKAVIRAGFVLMKYAREEGTRLTTKTASQAQYALDAARNNGGRAIMGATIKGNTVRGEACRYDVYES